MARSWCLVIGASEGLGAAFAMEAAKRGQNVALVARRAQALEEVAADVRQHGVIARTIVADLAAPQAPAAIIEAVSDVEVELLILNAAFAPRGDFVGGEIGVWLQAIDVNVRAPLQLAHHFGGAMKERRRGRVLIMSSMASFAGTPSLATYAGTKAFLRVFGEALWAELGASGVKVHVSCAGSIDTPGFRRQGGRVGADATEVAKEAIEALSHGPVSVPGRANRWAARVLRGLPSRWAVQLMGRGTRQSLGEVEGD